MANNISVKDGSGIATIVKTTDNATVHTPHHNVDTIATGASGDLGTTTDAEAAGNGSLIAILKRVRTLLGAGAAMIAKAEDAASANADVGVPAMAIRKATPANTSDADGDYEMLQMANGRLWASVVNEAGAAIIGKVGIDQTTPGTTDRVTVGYKTVTVDANFTRPADTTAYAANDAVTNSTSAPTIITLSNMARLSGGSGVILDAMLIDESNPATVGSFDLMLYDTTFTPNNDNAAFTPSTTVQRTFVGRISFNTQIVSGTNSQAYHVTGLNIGFTCVGSANLFAELVARNAYTPASAGRFDIRLKVRQD